jgi:phosphoribosyl 1,2-cyclic phosphate phosphodiesterase
LEIVVLGSAGAFRLPYLGCHCANCEAARQDPQKRRTTTSLWVRDGATGGSVLLDAGPDLYQQALREGIEQLDAIFLTHLHRDHMLGLECLETLVRYGQPGRKVMVFGPPDAVQEVRGQFGYLLRLGLIDLTIVQPAIAIEYAGYRVTAFPVFHHQITTYGYRLERDKASLVYLPDFKTFPDGQPLDIAPLPPAMRDAGLLFIDATFDADDWVGPGHIAWQEAAALGARSGAGRTVLVHFSHRVNLAALRQATHERLLEGYDGQHLRL